MLYALTCPACETVSQVDSDLPVAGWVCPKCGNESVSSLPTDGKGNLVDNPNVVVDAKYAATKSGRGFKPAAETLSGVQPDDLASVKAASSDFLLAIEAAVEGAATLATGEF